MAEDELQEELRTLEQERGAYNRECIRPMKRRLDNPQLDAPERHRLQREFDRISKRGAAILMALDAKREERRSVMDRRKAIGRRIRAAEHGDKARAARRTVRGMMRQGQKARLRLAREAVLTVEGLTHGDDRPSAWWLPAVDPAGAWFARIRRTARLRLEPLGEAKP